MKEGLRKTLFILSAIFGGLGALFIFIGGLCVGIADIPNLNYPLTAVIPLIFFFVLDILFVLLPVVAHRYWKEKPCKPLGKVFLILSGVFFVLTAIAAPINRAIQENNIMYVPHHEHELEVISQEAATCENAGVAVYKCAICDFEETKAVPATGHSIAEKVVQAATCSATGTAKKICSVCNKTEEIVLDKVEHTYEYTTTKAPTLEEKGIETGTCTVCGDTKEKELSKLGTKSNPAKVTVSELVAEINADIDAAKDKYNGKWIKITGKVTQVVDGGIMTGYYLYGKRGDSGLRIVCWRDGDIYKGAMVGNTFTFVGQVREITTFNATEIGDCTIIK